MRWGTHNIARLLFVLRSHSHLRIMVLLLQKEYLRMLKMVAGQGNTIPKSYRKMLDVVDQYVKLMLLLSYYLLNRGLA